MQGPKPIVSHRAHPWAGYAPKEPHRLLILLIERLCAANRSDRCIVSITKIQELLFAWWKLKRSRRWVSYHLKAARREMLIFAQTRWKARGAKGRGWTIELKARTRYRIGGRHFSRLAGNARQCIRLMIATMPHLDALRRESVQKVAHGLQNLLRSVVPSAP